MIKSMTGFGRAEEITDDYKLSVEIKSVNHRYLDLNIKMPRRFFPFEAEIRNIIKKYVSRGKVDLFINYLDFKDKASGVYLNKNIVKKYLDIGLELCKDYKIVDDIVTSSSNKCYRQVVFYRSKIKDILTHSQQRASPQRDFFSNIERLELFFANLILFNCKVKCDTKNHLAFFCKK